MKQGNTGKMHEKSEEQTIAAYAGYITNEIELLECTSGGIATAMSRETILERFKGSKYVEVENGTIYKDVKVLLEAGKSVLFFGLPCTVAAMKCFLSKDYDNLILVDLICHGSTDRAVHQQYIEYIKEKQDCRIHCEKEEGCLDTSVSICAI